MADGYMFYIDLKQMLRKLSTLFFLHIDILFKYTVK